jgi:hypothetical protein
VVLRTDCAKLTVQAPPAISAGIDGEGPKLYIYAIPEFDSMEGVYQAQIEPFEERAETLQDMVPGRYRVFAFRTPRMIESRNPAALDQLGPGQEVTIAPGGSKNLTIEEVSK